ncbi:MAG: T9SS type A sorting domain-containing protein [Flavobacteriales bacterium]|nr:T9SS type A sorting domain-containing protein [Flavobacteriales bacterium]
MRLSSSFRWAFIVSITLLSFSPRLSHAQHSVARQWNEANLDAIRGDFARPTIHARNLYHAAILMFDSWAAYEYGVQPYFLGDSLGNYACPFTGMPHPSDKQAAQEETMSYAMYRLISHRYADAPQDEEIMAMIDTLMADLGFDPSFTSTDYSTGDPAALGNYLATELITGGMQDGAREAAEYANAHYFPVNEDIFTPDPGNPNLTDFNRWQPVSVTLFIDQSGNPWPFTPPFLSPEWGDVLPFAMHDSLRATHIREDGTYQVWHDPGPPPYIDIDSGGLQSEEYKWGFSLVSVWSAHLDPSDSVMWDISPAAAGNFELDSMPTDYADYEDFYHYLDGGDASQGRAINPVTGSPYDPQLVPRGDFARVLAEFWADGPDSETPPGHWFTIYNEVSDHPLFERKWMGQGEDLNPLEYDVKAYLALGGAMHDAAIAAWSLKGWYDYLRPVSAIRGMADLGQCTDTTLSNYHIGGLPLVPGYIEVVEEGDDLAGDSAEHVGKIKLYAWRGPDYIENEDTDVAGVGWILAENWWPYQRPTFVTPPFAGYVSGHSTFSRAAAEVMTLMTGNEYFPGGMGEFHCPQNEFLVFEDGPSMDVTLQWATYRDASDQTSLSRIWGGIHPPADDLNGRRMGEQIGIDAFGHAISYFENQMDCSAFSKAPSGLRKSYNPVAGVQDRVQLKWFKDSLETRFSIEEEAACDIQFWAVKDLIDNSPIIGADTSLIPMSKVRKPGRELFKWPVKYSRTDVDPNTRYKWRVRCACDDGNGLPSPWSEVKIFNTPNFDPSTGIVPGALDWSATKDVASELIEFKIFPNPVTDGRLTIAIDYFEEKESQVEVRIFDLSGKTVLVDHTTIQKGSNRLRLELENDLAPGAYILELDSDYSQDRSLIQIH